MVVRKMTEADVQAVYEISCECFHEPWTSDSVAKEMSNPLAEYFVAEKAGKIIGYAGMWHMADEGEVINLAVSASARRQQVGEKLLQAMLNEGQDRGLMALYLEVRESNEAAQALYHKHGFAPIGRRKRYYQQPVEDAINMFYPFKK